MKKALPLAVILCAAVAMPAMAMKDRGHKVDHFFNEMDSNNDGVISRSESDAFGRRMFEEADNNNDRLISREEMVEHRRQVHEKHFGRYERDDRDYRDDREYGYRRDYRHGHMSPSAGRPYHPAYDNKPMSGSRNDQVYGDSSDTINYWYMGSDQDYPSERMPQNRR